MMLLPFLLSNCSIDADDKEIDDLSLVGTWQLVETYMDPGDGSGTWQPVEDGFMYTFYSDGNFISNKFRECTTGNYSIEGNKLILDYDCEGFTTGLEEPEGVFIEEISYIPGFILLDPVYVRCIEGCGYKYKKIAIAGQIAEGALKEFY